MCDMSVATVQRSAVVVLHEQTKSDPPCRPWLGKSPFDGQLVINHRIRHRKIDVTNQNRHQGVPFAFGYPGMSHRGSRHPTSRQQRTTQKSQMTSYLSNMRWCCTHCPTTIKLLRECISRFKQVSFN